MAKNKKLPDNQITVYQTPDGNINIEVLYSNENIWLPQKRMAELFGCSADNISLHLKNIYTEKELDESATAEDFSVVQIEVNREVIRNVGCYSLEVIIAVGYRVNSERGTQFHQWAISILQQYIHKGFAIDSDIFKYGSRFSTRYFDDLPGDNSVSSILETTASDGKTYKTQPLTCLRDTLLPKLMSGEVGVQLAQREAAI
jgi:hypothetical protein